MVWYDVGMSAPYTNEMLHILHEYSLVYFALLRIRMVIIVKVNLRFTGVGCDSVIYFSSLLLVKFNMFIYMQTFFSHVNFYKAMYTGLRKYLNIYGFSLCLKKLKYFVFNVIES